MTFFSKFNIFISIKNNFKLTPTIHQTHFLPLFLILVLSITEEMVGLVGIDSDGSLGVRALVVCCIIFIYRYLFNSCHIEVNNNFLVQREEEFSECVNRVWEIKLFETSASVKLLVNFEIIT